jgi:hypothetical protein
MNEPVSIIILNYNGKKYLKDCLSSVLCQSYSEFEIILFDNQSSDGSEAYVRENFSDPRLKLIVSKVNLGFAGGNNEALKHTSNDLTVLLNNDTKVEEEWLKYLVEAVKDKNTIASSFVITEGIERKYYDTNGSVSYLMYNVMNIFEKREDEFYPNGCSLIFRKSEIPEPFDKDYFYYSEDLYLGLKARFMGIKIIFAKDSIVHHLGGGGYSISSNKTFYQERNRLLNLFIFFSPLFILKVWPYVEFICDAKQFYSLFSKRLSFIGLTKAYFWLCFHMKTILRKRKEVRKFFKIDEKEVMKYMTSQIVNHENTFAKFLNSISYYYSRLVGIKPIEYYQKHPDTNQLKKI